MHHIVDLDGYSSNVGRSDGPAIFSEDFPPNMQGSTEFDVAPAG